MRANRIDLTGSVAIITGAGSGLGQATARRFVASGARVFGWDIAPGEFQEAGMQMRSIDISDEAAVNRAVDAVYEQAGGIDILVNCAGILGPHAPVTEISKQQWDHVLSVNLTGPFLTCRAVASYMQKAGAGRIINVYSAGAKDAHPYLSPYVAAKAGLVGLTRSLGKELGHQGIIVNCLTPGPMDTPMASTGQSQMSEAEYAALMQAIPLGRVAAPEEMAAMIAWMASDECSYTTASAFDASGGRTTY